LTRWPLKVFCHFVDGNCVGITYRFPAELDATEPWLIFVRDGIGIADAAASGSGRWMSRYDI
jgi:hypothetical protein